jgi:hypothetical protein
MLIPTDIDQDAVLAVPDPSYWAGTAAQYVYHNNSFHNPNIC